ncbi:MAG: hypothetical protein PHE59_03710 [Patescibacteria group bacterium]|nr:hypothetical protein [Patescibacteria group bacterium]
MKKLISILVHCIPTAVIMAILFTPISTLLFIAFVVPFIAPPKIWIVFVILAILIIATIIVRVIAIATELRVKKWVVFVLLFFETAVFWWIFYLYAVYFSS